MKALIVGLGSIAKKHIAALRNIDEKISICALRSSKKAGPIIGVINLYTFEDCIREKIDFVIISNPTFLHQETILQLLPLGCPLMIEKPSLSSLEKATFLNQKVEEKNILTYIACNLRFLDSIVFLREYLKSKERRINEVNAYCGSYLPDWRPEVDFRDIYSAKPEMGGGVHLDLIHEPDYLYWLFGKPVSSYKFLKNSSSLGIRAIDYAHIVLDYENFMATVTLNYYRKDTKRYLEVIFEDRTWKVDLITNSIIEGEEIIFKSEQSVLDTYQVQLEYFINLVKQGKHSSQNNLSNSIEVLKMVL